MIIVVEIGEKPFGLLADAVSDIISPTEDEMPPPPEATKSDDHFYVRALTFVDEKIVRILDLTSVLHRVADAA